MQIPILSKWFERRNLSKWEAWLDLLAGGAPATSGVAVNEDSIMTSSGVLACLRVLTFTMAMLPLPLYEKQPNGGKRKATEHTLYFLLHDSPNNYQTAFEFRQMLMTHVLLHGNFYAVIERDKKSGKVLALFPLSRPSDVEVKLFGQYPRYAYPLTSGERVIMDDREILHIRGMSVNGLTGLSMIEKGREPIGLAMALQEFAAKFFGQGATVGGVLEHPNKLSDGAKDYLTKAWSKTYTGITNAHKTAILEEGMKYNRIGIAPEEAQCLESRKFQVTEVARVFGVPPHMIGDLERATFSNIEHQGIEFTTYCVAPWATLIEQRISKQLLNAVERHSYFAEFSLEALMRGDYKSRQEGLHIQRQDGVISANEWRALENMNPIEGPEGDAYLVNGNMITVGLAMEGGLASLQQEKPPPGDDDSRNRIITGYNMVFQDALNRIIRREEADIMRKINKDKPESGELQRWIFDFYAEHEDFVRRNLEPVFTSLGAVLGENEAFAAEILEIYTKQHRAESILALTQAILAGDGAQAVFDGWKDTRGKELSTWLS